LIEWRDRFLTGGEVGRAAALADVKPDPAAAGKLFPIEWRKD
jgi:hypothetical protein